MRSESLSGILSTIYKFRIRFFSIFLLIFIFGTAYIYMLKPQYRFNQLMSLTTYFQGDKKFTVVNDNEILGYLHDYALPLIIDNYNKNHSDKNKLSQSDFTILPLGSRLVSADGKGSNMLSSNKLVVSTVDSNNPLAYKKFSFVSAQIVTAIKNYEQPFIKALNQSTSENVKIIDEQVPQVARLQNIEHDVTRKARKHKVTQSTHSYADMRDIYIASLAINHQYSELYSLKKKQLFQEQILNSLTPLKVSKIYLEPLPELPFMVKVILMFILSLLLSILAVYLLISTKHLKVKVALMKAVILAGGLGTRISEETDTKPKPMVEIGGKPILWHIMKSYSAHSINEFIICVGYKGYVIKEYFANYFLHMSDVTFDMEKNNMEVHQNYAEPWKVTLVDTGLETMTGGRLKRVKQYLGDEDFCFTYGDGLSDVNITELIGFHKSHGKLATVTAVKPAGRFGALETEGDNIIAFQEKPKGDGAWINGGYFVLSPKVIDYIASDSTVWEQEPMRSLVDDGKMNAFFHDGFWQPMDTLREKNQLEAMWQSEQAAWKVW